VLSVPAVLENNDVVLTATAPATTTTALPMPKFKPSLPAEIISACDGELIMTANAVTGATEFKCDRAAGQKATAQAIQAQANAQAIQAQAQNNAALINGWASSWNAALAPQQPLVAPVAPALSSDIHWKWWLSGTAGAVLLGGVTFVGTYFGGSSGRSIAAGTSAGTLLGFGGGSLIHLAAVGNK